MTPTHIAVLDDEVDITRLLAGYLETQGYRVTCAHVGRDLMAIMANDPPALVLLDPGLPGEDGFAIARQLREHFRCGLLIVLRGNGGSIGEHGGVLGRAAGLADVATLGASHQSPNNLPNHSATLGEPSMTGVQHHDLPPRPLMPRKALN